MGTPLSTTHSVPTTESSRAVAVELRAVRRVFDGDVVAVESIDLSIIPGEFVALLGPSGSGKSTLLRMIAGLDRPTSGRVALSRVPRLAYVFQDAHLLPWRNVLHNVALPLELSGVTKSERERRAMAAIEQVGLGDATSRYPAQLSGGMRMRASLARALVTEPELLLLDEPFAALDEITRQHLDDQLRALWTERGMTVVFVTHSIIEAAFLAGRGVVLTRRPGRVVIDHRLDLPHERTPNLRTDPQFAREMGVLFNALQRGERA
ncbi:MAG TPA: ABC transporter ATP-binding protein [Tepidisphaeraceae bacterium]|nr:ABC transporter ATP-binding protein [Tepidisphaeraceae bacterium]